MDVKATTPNCAVNWR